MIYPNHLHQDSFNFYPVSGLSTDQLQQAAHELSAVAATPAMRDQFKIRDISGEGHKFISLADGQRYLTEAGQAMRAAEQWTGHQTVENVPHRQDVFLVTDRNQAVGLGYRRSLSLQRGGHVVTGPQHEDEIGYYVNAWIDPNRRSQYKDHGAALGTVYEHLANQPQVKTLTGNRYVPVWTIEPHVDGKLIREQELAPSKALKMAGFVTDHEIQAKYSTEHNDSHMLRRPSHRFYTFAGS